MRTLKLIIELEVKGKADEAFEMAVLTPRDTWELYLSYRDFCDSLDWLLNKNFIL